jgi:hydrogenase expression/formation protein HypD
VKILDPYRDPARARKTAERIAGLVRRPWNLMEVCGGQTHTIVKSGLESLLPPGLVLLHGPGCPVCVTPAARIDEAITIALQPGAVVCSFGDMLRVPGSKASLIDTRAEGASVRMVYSPLESLKLASARPDLQVIFFAVGFETTAPLTAAVLREARRLGLSNFSMLVAHVRVPPVLEAMLNEPDNCVNSFLAAGHVCAVMGYEEYEPIAHRYRTPIVVTGFEPVEILEGIEMAVRQLEAGRAEVENQYARAVAREGNREARAAIEEVFEPAAAEWRGIGVVEGGGFVLRPEYRDFDASLRFPPGGSKTQAESVCVAGLVLRGVKKPCECIAFAKQCTPQHPLGAPMVSSEGACAAYYLYAREN